MERKSYLAAGATALAATAALLGSAPAAAAANPGAEEQSQVFSIQRIDVAQSQLGEDGADIIPCCNLFCCG